MKTVWIWEIESVEPPYNPRSYLELKERTVEILHNYPICVVRTKNGYRAVSGYLRLMAARAMGLYAIPVTIFR